MSNWTIGGIGLALIIAGAGGLAALVGDYILMRLGTLWSDAAPLLTWAVAWEFGKVAFGFLCVLAILFGLGLTLCVIIPSPLSTLHSKEDGDEAVRPDRYQL